MEKDFHYHLVYALARIARMKEPKTIAYASQFVDDNNEGQFEIDGKKIGFPEKIPANGGHFFPIMTQSLSIKSFDIYVQKYVYTPFHFLPGDNDVEIDGKKNPLSTTPNSQNAKALLEFALASGDAYQIGIAIHTYADTWSHQNFSGISEDWNSVYPWYNVFKSIAPNIGHAEAGHSPDVISDTWTDHRLASGKRKIKNSKRALDAAEGVYKMISKANNTAPTWSAIRKNIKSIIDSSDYDERIKKISQVLRAKRLGKIPAYDPNDWIDRALDKESGKVTMKQDFAKTDWHDFHQAAKSHFSFVLDRLKAL